MVHWIFGYSGLSTSEHSNIWNLIMPELLVLPNGLFPNLTSSYSSIQGCQQANAAHGLHFLDIQYDPLRTMSTHHKVSKTGQHKHIWHTPNAIQTHNPCVQAAKTVQASDHVEGLPYAQDQHTHTHQWERPYTRCNNTNSLWVILTELPHIQIC